MARLLSTVSTRNRHVTWAFPEASAGIGPRRLYWPPLPDLLMSQAYFSSGLSRPRRDALRAGARLLAAGAGLATGCVGAAQAAPDPAVAHAALSGNDLLQAVQVADGVHVLPGAVAQPDAGNAGRVGNLGFVVGRTGVAVIDTGSSRARAGELLAAIREVTDLPLRAVLLTHPAQEFLFGAGLFIDQGVPVLAHPATPGLMARRCQHCLDTLTHELGAARMAGTRLALPAPMSLPAAPLDLGGRRLQILIGPPGTVPGNLMVHDDATGVRFAGALLSIGRIPGLQDTRPADWQQALEALTAPDVEAVVPAYGPVAWRAPRAGQTSLVAASAALGGYFTDLEAQARGLYAAATPLAELADRAALPRYRDWNGYPATHLHNIFYRYLQLEAEDLSSH